MNERDSNPSLPGEKGISSRVSQGLEHLEKLKEVQRIQYDYFKHLTTICAASLAAIIAFITRVVPSPKCPVLVLISIVLITLCLLAALWAMPVPGNAILYMNGIGIIGGLSKEDHQKKEDLVKKYNKALGLIHVYDWITRMAFLFGVLLFLAFAYKNLAR